MFFKSLFGGKNEIPFQDPSKAEALKSIKSNISRLGSYDEIFEDPNTGSEMKEKAQKDIAALLDKTSDMICSLLEHPSNTKTKEDWMSLLEDSQDTVVQEIKNTYDEIVKNGGSL